MSGSAVAVFTHPDCLAHDPGPGHPETPARLEAVLEALRDEPLADVRQATPATDAPLLAVHPAAHLARLEAVARGGGGAISGDTAMSPRSWAAVRGAAGAVVAAVTHAHEGRGHAFAAARPPGHHALASTAMGFCFVNTVVVGAREAQRLGRERVLIIDWDVHHGNGTQALVEDDPSIRFVSLHRYPWYPGTGAASERGVGNVFNVPRPPDLPPDEYVRDLWRAVQAALAGWSPDLVLLSAGYDAMRGDPLGGFTLEPGHYAELVRRLRAALPDVPLVGVLEGGYLPGRVARGVVATVGALA